MGLIFVIGLAMGTFLIAPAFAGTDSELQKQTGNIIDQMFSWIYQTTDEAMEDVDVPDNPINYPDYYPYLQS